MTELGYSDRGAQGGPLGGGDLSRALKEARELARCTWEGRVLQAEGAGCVKGLSWSDSGSLEEQEGGQHG